ncbi:MAG: glycoside hydrolase family 127 protein [Candidatus Omnitrophica bacterium]|nr:glycoside hydrolase family 127 protein [Candidatus Omnitrophota bacterium]
MWETGVIKPKENSKAKIFPATGNIKISGFLGKYIETNRKESISSLYDLFLKYGEIDNLRIVAGEKKGEVVRRLATDSNLYKWMEAVSYDINNQMDTEREKLLDSLISLIGKAQENSGYINTFYTGTYKKERFRNLATSHELYCGGHLIQAAIAYHRATGKDNFLKIAVKWADYICKRFGKGKIEENDGHPEVEMALVELYRETGKEKYLELTNYFMSLPYKHLGNYPFLKFPEVLGHAVRMMYLCAGATDYYIETGDERYYKKLLFLWQDTVEKKIYITGGIGSRYSGEAIGLPYELPNLRAYAESCANLAFMMWAYRMFLVEGSPEFMDVFETILYNGFLSGVSLNGKKYFYVNPLASKGEHKRSPWYDCCCCPPNIQGMFTSLPSCFYGITREGIWINLYGASESHIKLFSGNQVKITQETEYPLEGRITIDIVPEKEEKFSLFLRIPGWADRYSIKLNGKIISCKDRGYIKIQRIWKPTKVRIELCFEVKPVLYRPHPEIESTKNCVAIKRGPVVYCLEQIDNQGINLFNCILTDDTLIEKKEDNFLGGVYTISGEVLTSDQKLPLYEKMSRYPEIKYKKRKFKAVPYYAWANRENKGMVIYLQYGTDFT